MWWAGGIWKCLPEFRLGCVCCVEGVVDTFICDSFSCQIRGRAVLKSWAGGLQTYSQFSRKTSYISLTHSALLPVSSINYTLMDWNRLCPDFEVLMGLSLPVFCFLQMVCSIHARAVTERKEAPAALEEAREVCRQIRSTVKCHFSCYLPRKHLWPVLI